MTKKKLIVELFIEFVGELGILGPKCLRYKFPVEFKSSGI